MRRYVSSFVVVKRAQFSSSFFFCPLAAQMHNVNKWNNCRMKFHKKFVIFRIFIIGFTIRSRCIYGASGGGIEVGVRKSRAKGEN